MRMWALTTIRRIRFIAVLTNDAADFAENAVGRIAESFLARR